MAEDNQVINPALGITDSDVPGIIIPEPFILSNQDKNELDQIKKEILDKVELWENEYTTFFSEFEEYANSWRMIPRVAFGKKPKGLFNSKSGETNRAVNTLATLWLRMLSAADPFFQAKAEGLDDFGREISEEDIYGAEAVLIRQMQALKFKKKLLKSLRSIALFGTAIIEEPWVTLPYGRMNKYFEGTDFQHRSLLQTGFNPFVFDIDQSDYIFTIDFITDHQLRNLSSNDNEVWNKESIENAIRENRNNASSKSSRTNTTIYNRIITRKQRAGYNIINSNVHELITYHGKIRKDSPVLQAYWQSNQRTDDIAFTDWTISILNGQEIVRLHPTPYGTWSHNFKIAHFNEFELEPIGYGVGKIGRKAQNELDITTSRMNDILMFALYSMWKVGRYAGLKANQLNIKPWNIIELDDIGQLEAIRPQIEAINQALNLQGLLKEDFRSTTGATANLQAIITKATATEASLTQNESMRGASVIAEIIADTFVRDHIETMHINNTDLLDNEIWISLSGSKAIRSYNRMNLPRNIGFSIKTTTDKDFRPERLQKLIEFLQLLTSIRNIIPNQVNILPFFEEAARGLGINPRRLKQAQPVADQMIDQLRKEQRLKQIPGLMSQMQGELTGEQAGGGGANVSVPTPQPGLQAA